MTRALESSADAVRARLAELLPARNVTSIRRLGEGEDHVAWLVGVGASADVEALVVRIARAGKAARDRILREVGVLQRIAAISPVPPPSVVLASAEEGIVVVRYLPGTSLLDLDTRPALAVARQLGALLTALHRAPCDTFSGFVEVDDVPLQAWLDEAREVWPAVASTVPRVRASRVEHFLAGAPPPGGGDLVLCHNDLGSEHLLVGAEGRLTGIIDWSDVAIADPAVDFARLRRDFGPDFVRSVRAHYERSFGDGLAEAAAWERIEFYARCSLIEDLAHAEESGDLRYRRAASRAIDHLFV